MDLRLTGKTALVTGSTAGIGFATATVFAREGAHIVINGRTRERVDDACAAIARNVSRANVRGVAADLGMAEGADAVVAAVPSVDVLVNNIGIFEPKPFEAITDHDRVRFFETNVMSGVRLSRAYLPKMLAAGWGRIVFVSSESAVQIPPDMIHHAATKTAQVAGARGLAELTVGTRVTVNSVLAGPTLSEGVGDFVASMAKARGATPEDVQRDFFTTARPTSIIKRFAAPVEIANMIATRRARPRQQPTARRSGSKAASFAPSSDRAYPFTREDSRETTARGR
jgi:NAD(P)-dependent dehydrogenase (short-subunit alcohol dehydrogenase family)